MTPNIMHFLGEPILVPRVVWYTFLFGYIFFAFVAGRAERRDR